MITLGTYNYLNIQPIAYGLERQLPAAIGMLRGVPTAINRALLTGDIAIGPISSYEFASNAHDLLLVPGLSIATFGAVNSVMLFSWRPDPRELDGAPVALTDHSGTSTNLLRVLCEQHYHIEPQWYPQPQDLDTMLSACDGALLIGDRALYEGVTRRHIDERGMPYCFDLGDEWLKLTSLPFTFAVWAVRRDCEEEVRNSGVIQTLYEAKWKGLRALETIAKDYAPKINLPEGVCLRYLQNLRYHLDVHDIIGLQTFLRYAIPSFSWDSVREIAV
jgi:chorismate dehydratase